MKNGRVSLALNLKSSSAAFIKSALIASLLFMGEFFKLLAIVVLFGFMNLVATVRYLFFDEHITSCLSVNLKEFFAADFDCKRFHRC